MNQMNHMNHMEKVRELMNDQGFDAVVCRLPENVLFLSDYWPVSCFSFVICPLQRDAVLLAVEMEKEYMDKNTIKDVRFFPWGTLDAGNPKDHVYARLKEIAEQYDLKGKRIAVEGSFEAVAPPFMSGEPFVPAAPTRHMIEKAFEVDMLYDATDLLHEARAIKTDEDIANLQIAHEVASFGLLAFTDALEAGKTEAEVAAAVEEAIYRQGTGYKGVKHVRGWAQLMTGQRASRAYTPFPASSSKVIQAGDIAVLELGVVADGYWADVTRTRAVETAGEIQVRAYQSILDAHKAIRDIIKDGAAGAEIDQAGRKIIEDAGFGQYFIHMTGHGLGFRYHEPIPMLHPTADIVLRDGMVTSVEPGIYIPGQWGMRLEENVVVRHGEPLYLSTYASDLL